MSKVTKEVKLRLEGLTDEQLERKVDEMRVTIPRLQDELDYAARELRNRRKAGLQRKVNEAR